MQLALETTGIAIAAMTAKLRLPEDAPADKPKRRPIPDHIPRMEVELTPGSADCARCGGKLRRLGEDVTEELEYVPGPSPPPLGLNQWRTTGGSSDQWRTKARHREPHRAAPDGLLRLRLLHPGTAALAPDRTRQARSGPSRACAPSRRCKASSARCLAHRPVSHRRNPRGCLSGRSPPPLVQAQWRRRTPNAQCDPSPWAARITSSSDRKPAANPPPSPTP